MITTKDMYYRKAKSISYDKNKRDKAKTVEYIVIHYTSNEGDTAKNNVDYFATGNPYEAGAHFFVDQKGLIGRSIPMENVAWAVATNKGRINNYNSVSIELCDTASKDPSDEMVKSVVELIKYICKYCPKVKGIARHYDVTGKLCPKRMVDDVKWGEFLFRIAYSLMDIDKK